MALGQLLNGLEVRCFVNYSTDLHITLTTAVHCKTNTVPLSTHEILVATFSKYCTLLVPVCDAQSLPSNKPF